MAQSSLLLEPSPYNPESYEAGAEKEHGRRKRGRRREEALLLGSIEILPYDVAAVCAKGFSTGPTRNVEGGVIGTVIEEPVRIAARVDVVPYDVAPVYSTGRSGCCARNAESGVGLSCNVIDVPIPGYLPYYAVAAYAVSGSG